MRINGFGKTRRFPFSAPTGRADWDAQRLSAARETYRLTRMFQNFNK